MDSDWFRQNAAEIGDALGGPVSEKVRKELENAKENWLLLADRIDEAKAMLSK